MESDTHHNVSFSTKYIKTKSTSQQGCFLISKWNSEVIFELAAEDPLIYNEWFFLPPSRGKSLVISIHLHCNDTKINVDNLQTVQDCFKKKKSFWESMSYNVEFFTSAEGYLIVQLECQLWTQTKVNTLSDYQINEKHLSSTDVKINYLKQIKIVGQFNSNETTEICIDKVVFHLREYLTSLMISQLEFKFPLIFSRVARKRIKEQESSFTVVSYAIKGNSTLFLKFLKMANNDKTASSIFQILSNNNYGQRLDMV